VALDVDIEKYISELELKSEITRDMLRHAWSSLLSSRSGELRDQVLRDLEEARERGLLHLLLAPYLTALYSICTSTKKSEDLCEKVTSYTARIHVESRAKGLREILKLRADKKKILRL
jgi:hypothetical protein